jgi:hypothetical protein
MTTRAEQQELTPRDHSKIRAADPDYPPDPPPAEDVEAFAAAQNAKRAEWEEGRRLYREAYDRSRHEGPRR